MLFYHVVVNCQLADCEIALSGTYQQTTNLCCMVATTNRDRNVNNGFLCLGLSSLCVAGRGFAYIGVGGGTNSKDSKNSGF
jgi:hypothetical protein